MHQGWPWLVFQFGVTATVSWTTVATWFGANEETRPLDLCSADDERVECSLGHQREPEEVHAPGASSAKPRRLEDIKIKDLVPRRRRHSPQEESESQDGDPDVLPPADYYDDMFARLLRLVGELLGRAAVAAIKWLWIAMDWLGS